MNRINRAVAQISGKVRQPVESATLAALPMADLPTYLQLILVVVAGLLVAAGAVASAASKRGVIALPAAGLALALLAQGLHSANHGDWLPLQDNFDALLWLAILIGGGALYLRAGRIVPRVDLVSGPIVIVLLAGAAIFGRARPHEYTNNLWSYTHLSTAFGSAVAFALGACAGVLYLMLRRKLRAKTVGIPQGPPDAGYGSLERLERLNYAAVQVGFVLLTVGLATGLFLALRQPTKLGDRWYWQPKVLLSFGTYALYAVVLNSPITPTLRGRKTAILSIAGFVLLLGTLAAVNAMK